MADNTSLKNILVQKYNSILNSIPSKFTFNFNYRIIVVLFAIIFGFYGWGTNPLDLKKLDFNALVFFLCNTFVISITLILLYTFRDMIQFSRKISLGQTLQNLKIFIFIFISLIFLNYKSFSRSLAADELAHAWFSHAQSYVLTLKRLGPFLPNASVNLPAQYLIQFFSLFILCILFIFILFCLRLKTQKNFLFLMIFFLVISRFAISIFGGFSAPNSPLPNFLYFIFTSFFGINNLTFRIASILPFAILYTYIFQTLSKKISKAASYLSIIAIASNPLLQGVSNLVEIANWGYLASAFILFRLIENEEGLNLELLLVFALSFYLRNPLIYLIPGLFVLSYHRFKRSEFRRIIITMCIILLPGLLQVLIRRVNDRSTESISAGSIRMNIEQTTTSLELSGSLLTLIFFTISFVILWLLRKDLRKFECFFVFGIVVVFFISNGNEVTRISKYLTEIIYPLATSFFLILFTLFKRIFRSQNLINVTILVLSATIFLYNIQLKSDVLNNYSRLAENTSKIDSGYEALPYDVADYDSVFLYIRNSNRSQCLNTGVVYSVFPEVLNGMSLKYVLEAHTIREQFLKIQDSVGESPWGISLNTISKSGANCVILGPTLNSSNALKDLLENGWKVQKNFHDYFYNTSTIIVTKSI